jgi:hypothetical protein
MKPLQEFDKRELPAGQLRRDVRKFREGVFLGQMNAEPQSAAVKRVVALILLLQEADDLRGQIWRKCERFWNDKGFHEGHMKTVRNHNQAPGVRSGMVPNWMFSDPSIESLNHALCTRLAQIDVMLQRYRWVPAVRCDGYIRLEYLPTWVINNRDADWENSFVCHLLRTLQGMGLSPSEIQRYRRCRRCNRWFYAVTDHQKNCSDICRKKFNSTSDEFRSKRATYMRERYRPLQRELQERSKCQGRRKSRPLERNKSRPGASGISGEDGDCSGGLRRLKGGALGRS